MFDSYKKHRIIKHTSSSLALTIEEVESPAQGNNFTTDLSQPLSNLHQQDIVEDKENNEILF